MLLFRQSLPLLSAVGAGIIISILYTRLTNKLVRELQQLSATIRQLQAELALVKEKLDSTVNRQRLRRPASGYTTVTSNGEDDEEDSFEEAYGGSDIEGPQDLVEQLAGTNSLQADTNSHPATVAIFEQVDKQVDGTDQDKREAYEILENNKYKFITDPNFHWRHAKSAYQVSQIEGELGNAELKKQLIYVAKDSSHTAISLDDQCANGHKWYAISIGRVGEYEGTQAKIKNGYTYKEHIEKAINLKPLDPSNRYLLGRWCYGVYMLSWLERKAAATLFAAPPTATAQDALTHFLKADELNPGKWKENILYIGKCYVELRQYREAVEWMDKGCRIRSVSIDDKASQAEMESLLAKYRSYA